MARRAYTFNELTTLIDGEYQWRRKELFVFKSKIPIDSSSVQKAYLRAAITMLYAHTEGFVKNASTLYLQFVKYKYLPYRELNSALLTLSIKSKFPNLNILEKQVELVDFFFNETNSNSNIPYKNIINTRSNLNYNVLEEILITLGFNVSNFERRQEILDDLVTLRNTIAHGEFKNIDLHTYQGFYDEIESFLAQFKTEIENSALMGTYRR
jgi:hypothetical protein